MKDKEIVSGQLPLVDTSLLHEMFRNNASLIRQLELKFIQNSDEILLQMKDAEESKDLKMLEFLGHKLKSSTKLIGALQCSDLCEKLEKASMNKDWATSTQLLIEIYGQLSEIKKHLQCELESS
ncbi:MAG: Hpt domain-containing protein [Nitrosomonas sp.]